MEPMQERSGSQTRMTIAAVSSLLGIPVPTIRSWERRYGFPVPSRTQGKHRRYSVDEIDQLRMMRDEITRGHSASEAVDIVRRYSTEDRPRAELLDRFLEAAMRLDPVKLRETLMTGSESMGVEETMRLVALPAMREMGSRWKAGVCDTAHEHLATEAVRVWLARQSAMAPAAFRPFPLVLACGPKDLHTIGLEAFGVVLARRGWSIRTLGPLTPVASLVAAVRAAEARGAVVTSQRGVTRRSAVEAIAAVEALPGVEAFYGGAAFGTDASRRDVPGTYLGEDIVEAAEILERMLAKAS
jgi:DNA-binding transcriptional MerR regulator